MLNPILVSGNQAATDNGQSPLDDLQEQTILVDKAFVEKIQEMIKEKEVVVEIPRKQSVAGRQSLGELFSDAAEFTKELSNQKVARAHLENILEGDC